MGMIGRGIGGLLRGIGLLWQVFVCWLANLCRGLFRGSLPDYVLFELSGQLLEREPQQPWYFAIFPFARPALTLASLRAALRRTAGDPNVSGVLIVARGVQISLAQAQSLAAIFQQFREWDRSFNPSAPQKEIVIFLETCSNAEYAMAAAADRIFVSPLTDWSVLGLRTEPTFLADTLAKLGVQAEVVKVAPWKTAYDTIERAEISPAHRQQLNSLLDSWYEDLVETISVGRSIGQNQARSHIDRAPLTAAEAEELQLIDGIAYEDQLPTILGIPSRDARIQPYEQARRWLYRRPRRRASQAIGVLALTGVITSGKSRRFPGNLPVLGGSTTGSTTAQQQIRAALADERLAGVLLHVDSSGGSALASDLIWRELTLLARKKPVVAYLGDVAASGGYYVALPAQKIICQPATLTGSIGVITAKLLTSGALDKIDANRYTLRRGKNADIYSDSRPWRGEQRDKIEDQVSYSYRNFKERVAAARDLSFDGLDEIAGGRVWTGRQAQEKGLVDELGDFAAAVNALCALADLPTDGSVRLRDVEADRPLPPLSERSLGLTPGTQLADVTEALLALLRGDVSALLGTERIWLLAEGLPRLK